MARVTAQSCFFLLLASLLSASFSGCATLNGSVGDLLADGDAKTVATIPIAPGEPPMPGESPNGQSTIAVEFYPVKGQPERGFVEIDGSTCVQDVLDQTNTHGKFSRMVIQINRQLPNGGAHKFDVKYDRRSHQVTQGFDYALHPGDRLQVTEDPSTALDDMLDSIGSFGIGLPH